MQAVAAAPADEGDRERGSGDVARLAAAVEALAAPDVHVTVEAAKAADVHMTVEPPRPRSIRVEKDEDGTRRFVRDDAP